MENIARARGMRLMSQKELSEKTKINRVTISGYETGSVTPSIENLVKMADALDVTTDYLLGRTNKHG